MLAKLQCCLIYVGWTLNKQNVALSGWYGRQELSEVLLSAWGCQLISLEFLLYQLNFIHGAAFALPAFKVHDRAIQQFYTAPWLQKISHHSRPHWDCAYGGAWHIQPDVKWTHFCGTNTMPDYGARWSMTQNWNNTLEILQNPQLPKCIVSQHKQFLGGLLGTAPLAVDFEVSVWSWWTPWATPCSSVVWVPHWDIWCGTSCSNKIWSVHTVNHHHHLATIVNHVTFTVHH